MCVVSNMNECVRDAQRVTSDDSIPFNSMKCMHVRSLRAVRRGTSCCSVLQLLLQLDVALVTLCVARVAVCCNCCCSEVLLFV